MTRSHSTPHVDPVGGDPAMSTAQPEHPDIDVLPCGHPDDDPAVFHTGYRGDAVCSRCCPTCKETTDGR